MRRLSSGLSVHHEVDLLPRDTSGVAHDHLQGVFVRIEPVQSNGAAGDDTLAHASFDGPDRASGVSWTTSDRRRMRVLILSRVSSRAALAL